MIVLSFNLCSLIGSNGFIQKCLAFILPLVGCFPIFVLIFKMNLLVESVDVVGSGFVPFCVSALVWLGEGAVQSVVSFVNFLGMCGYTSVSILEISFSLLETHLFILVFLLMLFHFLYHPFSNIILILFQK